MTASSLSLRSLSIALTCLMVSVCVVLVLQEELVAMLRRHHWSDVILVQGSESCNPCK